MAMLMTEFRTPLYTRMEELQEVLAGSPDDPAVLRERGECSLLRGRVLEAIQVFQQLVRVAPEDGTVGVWLSQAYLEGGLVAEAASCLREVLQAHGGNVSAQLTRLRLVAVGGESCAALFEEWAGFLPLRGELETERERVTAITTLLDGEITALESAGTGDPVVAFSLEMARERRSRWGGYLGDVAEWERRHEELDEAERLRLEEEERVRREAEEAERRRLEEEERIRREAEEAERLRLEEEERVRREAEEAERRRLEEEERTRREAEEAERLRLEEEERIRREAEEAERLRVEEEERIRREAEEAERLRVEEEERIRREAEEAERLRVEEEERIRREAEEAAQAAQRAREDAYEALRKGLDPVVGVLLKTKGVTSVLVVARDGMPVHRSLRDEISHEKISSFVADGVGALDVSDAGGHLATWQYWVLEFSKGILVLQKVTQDYYLVVVGQAGANFGVLTWTIDKNRTQLEEVLKAAPPVP